MGTLQFIASLVASLVWPVTLVTIVLLLRRYMPEMLRALRKLKVSGFELELERARVEVEGAVSTRSGANDADGVASTTDLTLRASQQDPVASILSSYMSLEDELRKQLALAGIAEPSKSSALQLVRLGVSEGVFPEASVEAVRGVSVMRNLVAHGRAERVTVREAVEYAALVEATIYSLGVKPRE